MQTRMSVALQAPLPTVVGQQVDHTDAQQARFTKLAQRLPLWIVGLLLCSIAALWPVGAVKADSTIVSPNFARGQYHSCILMGNGTVRCWGENSVGQLGSNTTDTLFVTDPTTYQLATLEVAGITDAVAISATQFSTCAVLSDGTIRCWGAGNFGDGAYSGNSTTPVQPIGITNAVGIVGAYDTYCALLATGSVSCWGAYLLSGLGTNDRVTTPTELTSLGNDVVELVGAGPLSATQAICARKATKEILCWGNNALYVLGGENGATVPTPTLVPGSTAVDFVNLTGTAAGFCGVTTDGTIKCWGGTFSTPTSTIRDIMDILPDNSLYYVLSGLSYTPPEGPFHSVVAVNSAGHLCVLTQAGVVHCRGQEAAGYTMGTGLSFPTGSTPYYVIPTQIPLGLNGGVTQLMGDVGQLCAVTAAGELLCWNNVNSVEAIVYTPTAFSDIGPGAIASAAGLAITKSGPTPNPPVAGQPVQYTIVVTNSSSVTQTNVTVTEMPSAGLTMSDFTSTPAGSCSTTSGKCTLTDPLAPGASASFLATFDVSASAGAVISNTAYVTSTQNAVYLYPTTPPALVGVTGASSVATTNLMVTKSAAATSATSGTDVVYTIAVSNVSGSAATNVRAVDTLPNNVTFNSASAADGGSCTHSSGTVTCLWGSLAGGASTTATINVTPN